MINPVEPVTITACGALTGDKFKTTVKRITPTESEILFSADNEGVSSVEDMADYMHGLTLYKVIPRQKEEARRTGIAMASPIIMGWEGGNDFPNCDVAFKAYPKREKMKKYSDERDQGALACAVDQAYLDSESKLPFMTAYRIVTNEPFGPIERNKVDPAKEAKLKQLIRRASLGDDNGKRALTELRKMAFDIGFEIGSRSSVSIRLQNHNPNDLTKGNRFSCFSMDDYGTLGRRFLRLWDLRKHLADGIRSALKYTEDHILCPKILGLHKPERPLVNVAESIALQDFIRKGHMKKSDVSFPYA